MEMTLSGGRIVGPRGSCPNIDAKALVSLRHENVYEKPVSTSATLPWYGINHSIEKLNSEHKCRHLVRDGAYFRKDRRGT